MSQDGDIRQMQEQLRSMAVEISGLKEEIKILRIDKENALKYGIGVLGTAVAGLVALLYNILTKGH
jgi:hypothetical protein